MKMKNVYILHGCCDRQEFEDTSIPSGSNFHWIPWLQKQLIIKGYNCQTPEMPRPYKPLYSEWRTIFESYPLDENTILVAHICGCGFLLRYLSEAPRPIEKLVLVAPWLDPDEYMGRFLKFQLNRELNKTIERIHIFYSKDEPVKGVKYSVDKLMNELDHVEYHEFDDRGHFCLGEMGTQCFPELLDVVLS